MKTTKHEVITWDGTDEYFGADLSVKEFGGVRVVHDTGVETWYAPGEWKRLIVSTVAATIVEDSEFPQWWNTPGSYVGVVVSFKGSGNPVVEFEGDGHEFSAQCVSGDLEGDNVVVTVHVDGPPVIKALAKPQKENRSWWSSPGSHDGKLLTFDGDEPLIEVNGVAGTIPLSMLTSPVDEIRTGSRVQVAVSASGMVTVRPK